MTENEWLAGTDPAGMLRALAADHTPGLSGRKLRLFACACCRQVWHLLTDPRTRHAVEMAEQFADGEATEKEMIEARREANPFQPGLPLRPRPNHVQAVFWACSDNIANTVALAARAALPITPHGDTIQAALLRDIVGNPFRPVLSYADLARHGILDWNGNTVPRLARAAYDERSGRECPKCYRGSVPTDREDDTCPTCHGTGRSEDGAIDPTRLAVLADALEEAGCDSEDFLAHLRSPVLHVRGCWVLDLLLGKE